MVKNPKLKKEIKARHFFSLAFGATIGVGWIMILGDWLEIAGPLGAIIGFFGGILVLTIVIQGPPIVWSPGLSKYSTNGMCAALATFRHFSQGLLVTKSIHSSRNRPDLGECMTAFSSAWTAGHFVGSNGAVLL